MINVLLSLVIDYMIVVLVLLVVVLTCEYWCQRRDRADEAAAEQRDVDRIHRETAASVQRLSDAYLLAQALIRDEAANRRKL